MRYISTRGAMASQPFTDVLLEGLAPDGGLAMPQDYPQVSASQLKSWRELNYADLAFEILSLYADDIPLNDLKRLTHAAYRPSLFGSEEITPLKTLEPGFHLLALSNGPTLAFKDMAMQWLGQLFEYELERRNTSVNILGATSGDTGSAAEYAMLGKRRVSVFMLSPQGRMSAFQRAQMYSLLDKNIHNLVIPAAFDQCQDIVKAVSNDLEFKQSYRIGAVNSINWARVCAQVVYYFKGWMAATNREDQEVSFAVPSGNFGNVLAGHIARQMGLPIHQLVIATNENNVLDEFFQTGIYRPRTLAQTHITSSPSMDISKASNFERFIFDVLGRDAQKLKSLWNSLDQQGYFDFFNTGGRTPESGRSILKQYGLVSGSSTHADRIKTIQNTFKDYELIIDPHTADGVKVAQQYRQTNIPMLVLETALPAKFSEVVEQALNRLAPRPQGFESIEEKPQRFELCSNDSEAVKQYIRSHAMI